MKYFPPLYKAITVLSLLFVHRCPKIPNHLSTQAPPHPPLQCAAYPAIPWHCTLSLPSTHSSCSFIFAPGRLANPILLLQTCPATAHIYISTFIYIYTYILYIYTHTYNHIFHYSVAMLSSVCRQPNCLSHSLQSHAPQKRWVGGTRAVALLITMVYNTCN